MRAFFYTRSSIDCTVVLEYSDLLPMLLQTPRQAHFMSTEPPQSPDLLVVTVPVAQEHTAAINQLAEDSNWPVPVVEQMYLHELSELKKEATIDTYLGLLAERKVRATLRQMPRRAR